MIKATEHFLEPFFGILCGSLNHIAIDDIFCLESQRIVACPSLYCCCDAENVPYSIGLVFVYGRDVLKTVMGSLKLNRFQIIAPMKMVRCIIRGEIVEHDDGVEVERRNLRN
ncbi:hypothetical protein RHSIM_Rhsim09G0051100 [Rhododendron simsii]|uniref:Uncharacterized protein n=1 Tax=Rhododendron simsii TaxID=118357 RepID=A0A834GEX0_RHOSS|nr:hypothetical protein RHSIM_Rhsim09G0051100 [Rhododendron simsii]